MTTILSLIREAQYFRIGSMHGVNNTLIYRHHRVPVVPRSSCIVVSIRWKPPPPFCYKLNVDRSVRDGYMHARYIF